MVLPADDFILLSVINTKLRDEYSSLEDSDDSGSELDFFPMMELVEMDADGNWHIDTQAVEAVADEYFN